MLVMNVLKLNESPSGEAGGWSGLNRGLTQVDRLGHC